MLSSALTCCKEFPNPRLGSDNFTDRVKRFLLIAKKTEAVLAQKSQSCSLEGLFVIANLVTEEEEKSLLGELELSETFHKELEAVVTDWNILEPLTREGYSLEEVFLALMSIRPNKRALTHAHINKLKKTSIHAEDFIAD